MDKQSKKSQGKNTATPEGKRSTFSGKIGYVLSVAGSAVGLGNIWRFPYLAARYGGGAFLLVYILLAVTFGFTLIVSETTLGRMTRKSPAGAFRSFGKSPLYAVGGWINSLVPMLVTPYYCVIGGWVTRYLWMYISGQGNALAEDGDFVAFMTSSQQAELWFLIFAGIVLVVILAGVNDGVERMSRIMMPMLVVLAIVIALYVMTRPGAMAGVRYFLVPDFKKFSWKTIVAAMQQLFFSLSISMGILYTYGSYMKKEIDIEESSKQVELFDTGIAVLAGLMIIPAVFAYSGGEANALNSGPSLMFITMPKIFQDMHGGQILGSVFFILVMFAALTSAIALFEAAAVSFADEFYLSRKVSSLLMAVITIVLGSLTSMGYGTLEHVRIIGMQILDFFDFLANNILMPLGALATCLLITRVAGIYLIEKEVEVSSAFKRRKIYRFCIKYLVPICLVIIFGTTIASVLGWISL